MLARHALLLSLAPLGACASLPQQSQPWNPIGWPSKLLSKAGFEVADSGTPLLRELGRLLQATGELADTPALLLEGLLGADGERLLAAGEHLNVGTGSSFTALWNLPFFWVPGRNLDLGRDVELVNEALAYLETQDPASWHTSPDDRRTQVFPEGTRARASGKNLIYTIPGYGDVLQAGEANQLWSAIQSLSRTNFPAQERSWGFIVRSRERWDTTLPGQRAKTILHELYHQQMQMRRQFHAWTAIYWPAYLASFPFTGWQGHWAEMNGPNAAGAVDKGLGRWRPQSQ